MSRLACIRERLSNVVVVVVVVVLLALLVPADRTQLFGPGSVGTSGMAGVDDRMVGHDVASQ